MEETATTIAVPMSLTARILVASCVLGAALCVAAGTGCRKRTPEEASRHYMTETFGRLPGLSETPDPQLRAELARIVEEHGTPELLRRPKADPERDVASGLAGLFGDLNLARVFDQSTAIWPPGEFRFDPTRLERAIRFRRKYEEQRRAARATLARPGCWFDVQPMTGFAADLSAIDVLRICARLEAFLAAEMLAEDDLAGAIDALESMFRMASCLAEPKHAMTRLQAALLRSEALALLQAIVRHPELDRPKITSAQFGRLNALVAGQVKDWPPDADAWIGDRALGMHAYEQIRAGRLVEILTEEEIERFASEKILRDLPGATRRNANPDELYYLDAMRRIIASCERPYFERRELFASIRADLHEQRNSPKFPFVAARLLLVDIEQGHAIQAADRASCEGWALALATATGKKVPPYRVSPLSGEEYEVRTEEGLVTVRGIAPDEPPGTPPIVVPCLACPAPEP